MVESLTGVRSAGLLLLGSRRLRTLKNRCRTIGPLGWHAIYFTTICLVASFIFYGVGRRVEAQLGENDDGFGERMSYLDALFLGVTSATGAGLGNVVVSRLDTLQQVVAFLLILFGSQVWVASCVVNIQRALLARRILGRCQDEMEKKKKYEEQQAGNDKGGEGMEKRDALAPLEVFSEPPVLHVSPKVGRSNARLDSTISRVTARLSSSQSVSIVSPRNKIRGSLPGPMVPRKIDANEWASDSDIDACSFKDVHGQQDTLAALHILSWVLPTYMCSFQILGTLCLGAWMSARGRDIVGDGVGVWWFGAFNTISAFNNSGMSLLDENMLPFQTRGSFIVWVQCILILAGNSGFPIFLKAILLLMRKIGYGGKGMALLLGEKGGRKVFPYLFGSRETRWLVSMLAILNGIDWVAFAIAAPGTVELAEMSNGHRLLCGLFQALSVRSGGFGIVSVRQLHIGVQMAYTVMLYMSAFPVVLPNIPHPHHAGSHLDPRSQEPVFSFITRQLRGLMRAGDLRYLASAVWFICVVEAAVPGEVFPVVFEVASAFGCVGVSFGAVKTDGRLALVGDWRGASKLCLAAVMLWGRVREVRRGILMDWSSGEVHDEREMQTTV